ncbi:DUF1524 domain-containing protein [Hoyosella rhizosphaerae]|uniref:Calcium-binding protein n=1 Tax=Hoyosella rhizosphaerae TaxID=1755582 RepID=A0A916U6L2_9ACTN|nr:DUF1524 domain-containing protein [Hoyosella rhizosphaerae]MBN4926198.1 DUF1524 domain-containing protein [Hoyosella rhizosphaerae]GGC61344.1 calcium-binding protein [Hoyosella rhizosphaerae]
MNVSAKHGGKALAIALTAVLALLSCGAVATEESPTVNAPLGDSNYSTEQHDGILTGQADEPLAETELSAPIAEALAQLLALEVKGRAPKTGYSRDEFGPTWTDAVDVDGGRNGCDTRNDILRRDLVDLVIKPGSNGCSVLAGTLHDPYTGRQISFVRGQGTSSDVHIDHVVALSDAWQKGAQQWDPSKRQNFANDPRNLLAVDGSANQQKSDGDAATWLPPHRAFRCSMVAIQVDVKTTYGLWVTRAERDAIERVLNNCGSSGPQLPGTVPPMMPELEATIEPDTKPAQAPSNVYYKNCTAAREAGAAPIYAGQPGYRSELDRDGDGVACE